MKTATASALRSHLGDYLDQAEPVVVTRNGQPRAVLLPVEDADDVERLLMANSPALTALLDEADQRIARTGGIPHDAFWARVERESPARKQASTRARKRSRTPRRGDSS